MIQRVDYKVFISYRRDAAHDLAALIADRLQRNGFPCFLDVRGLGVGHYGKQLTERIQATPNFIVILTPGSLNSCNQPGDWLRAEIACAIRAERKIIPVMVEGFAFPPDGTLPEDIADLADFQAAEYSHRFIDASIDELLRLLRANVLQPRIRLGRVIRRKLYESVKPVVILLSVLAVAIFTWKMVTRSWLTRESANSLPSHDSVAKKTEATRRLSPGDKTTKDILDSIVGDPRFSQEKFTRAVQPMASLKRQILERNLVDNMNKVYGWNLSKDGRWSVQQCNDLIYEIVLAPGYDEAKFLAATKAGHRP